MRTYTLMVMRGEQILLKEELPFRNRTEFVRLLAHSLDSYALHSGVDLKSDDVEVSLRR